MASFGYMDEPLVHYIYTSEDKTELEEISGLKLYIRNTFEQNQTEIGHLLEQGKQNAMVYLQRNRLGQKLSLFEENNLFVTLVEIQKTLGLSRIPRRIECYDISHLSGTYVYGSMITFVDGRPAKKFYRLFKCKEQNNDFENHREVLRRRLLRGIGEDVADGWILPDLIIVDGGKGQLSSDFGILQELGLDSKVDMVSLAKREEEIFVAGDKEIASGAKLGREGGVLFEGQAKFMVQRIRDEAHRFAITNNRNARLKSVTKSELDDIAGIGPKTKQKLLITFGSVKACVEAMDKNPELVWELVGKSNYQKLKKHFG